MSGTAEQAAASVYCFEPFVLNVRSGELRRGEHTTVLQEQPFRILRRLIESAGAVVGRDELCRTLWVDGTFVDYEHGLNAAIRRLRRALADNAAAPRFVETIPRRGYRLIAPIRAGSGCTATANRARTRLAIQPLSRSGVAGEFADGLTEELMVQVWRASRDRVALAARAASIPRAALDADYLLEGSVRTDGARVRVTAWLVEAASETRVWTDTADGDLQQALAGQVDVATRLARSLDAQLRRVS
jgi:DNA-binding winged helix-turn-helix (wHTH) protein